MTAPASSTNRPVQEASSMSRFTRGWRLIRVMLALVVADKRTIASSGRKVLRTRLLVPLSKRRMVFVPENVLATNTLLSQATSLSAGPTVSCPMLFVNVFRLQRLLTVGPALKLEIGRAHVLTP